MPAVKIAVSIPKDVLDLAHREVTKSRAKSLSALVTEAVSEKLRRDELARILDDMDRVHGKPGKADRQWVARVLSRSS